jgi:DNA invertase Pin-like site-specific DNA recombinase
MNLRIRCAIYTRKSSEEGLEQSFNSLDAQREACESFIKSQQHEGWQVIPTHYSDGGYTGGNMDRPALRHLMADIHAGKVSVVVVYKVDRLTRSLADFAKMIEQFDEHTVSFVSVTQQFNTTTSMGRLTLNVLLSFAQFEREVTGERIRDKIAASKKKGMWMGGRLPLGYTAQDRKLVINEAEAVTVRTIFQEFLRSGSVNNLRGWLHKNNIRSRSGNHFFRGPLYTILRNPHYLGLIKHKKQSYPGEHSAIVDRETWDKVQALLNDNIQGKRRKGRATQESLFIGILYDAVGTRYTPTHTNKSGRRYRYYTSQAVIKKTEQGNSAARIPAYDLEKAVENRILEWLASPTELLAALRDETTGEVPEGLFARIVAPAAATTQSWRERMAWDRTQFLKTVIDRVVILADHVEIRLRVAALVNEILSGGPPTLHLQHTVSIDCPFRHIPQGRALRLVVGDTNITTDASRQAILKAIARARLWYKQLTTGKVDTIVQLASLHQVSPRFIHMQMKLVQLSPQSIKTVMTRAVIAPVSLRDMLASIPMNWRHQRIGTIAALA